MDLHPVLKHLAAHADPAASTVTIALDLSKSGRLPAATRVFLKDQVYGDLASEARPEKVRTSLRKLARRIREFVEKKVRPETDGLYLAAGPGLWEAVELRVPLRNLVVVGRAPYLPPLIEAMRRAPRAYHVELGARDGRIEETHLGERSDLARLEARVPREDVEHATAVHGGAERDLHQRRRNAASKALAVEAAARVVELHRSSPAEFVFASDPEFIAALPAALRDRVVAPGASSGKAYEEQVAREVEVLRSARAQGLKAALGAREVLEGMASGMVERVFVDADDPYPGVVCSACGTRFPELHARCPYCEGDVFAASMTQEVVAYALSHPPLELTFVKASWLKDLGGMAALLRRKGVRRSRTSHGILSRGS